MSPQDELKHYGILRKSGRYPWGSGGSSYQRSMDFKAMVDDIKDTLRRVLGMEPSDKEIAQALGYAIQEHSGDPKAKFTITDYRDTITISKEEIVSAQSEEARKLKDKGMSIEEISKKIGIPGPTVRLRLKNYDNQKRSITRATADVIRKNVDEHQIVDIGKGTNLNIDTGTRMGISPEKLRAAVSMLRDEGYETYNLQTPQVGTKQFTNQLVIVPPGTGFGNAKKMTDRIHTMGDWSEDDGQTWKFIQDPISVKPSRVKIAYDSPEDGIIYLRRGVKDLNMGKNTYAQVRIMVNDSHYIKGVALYKDDLPPGVDIEVHSNKKPGTPMLGDKNNTVLKPKTEDPANPFGSIIKRQIIETQPNGQEKVTSALNLVNEEGDWEDWRKSLPSQMLAKQPHSLIDSQLQTTRVDLKARLDEINSITNPVVKREALKDFADRVDSDAVDLRAAAMPRQRTQLIVPMPKMNKSEIYAPRFETGERVVLIRYPHGGRFEIPEVTVNNNNRTAKKLLGDAKDAIGIHPSVAERLSGADFDGDTVVVIPNRQGKIKGASTESKTYDQQLKNFNAKDVYGGYEEINGKGTYKLMTNTGLEMGKITNLITDMQVQNATPDHIVRAVKHSMVVIDAEKHKLNYKKSESDHNIKQLVALYQSHPDDPSRRPGGASTLLSQATAKDYVPERKLRPAADGGPLNEDGSLAYVPTGRMRSVYDRKTRTYSPTEKVLVEEKVKRLALTDDAYSLVRDKSDPVERLYAEHANAMKALANQARLQAAAVKNPPVNSAAKKVYEPEVNKLLADLRAAEAQKPLDRRAQVYANSIVKAKRQEDPLLSTDSDRRKKVERQALAASRARLGLSKPVIEVTPKQWDAIQAGAVSASKLSDILKYTDQKVINDYALPKSNPVMTSAITARAKAMLAAGATTADVAAALGIPMSTLSSAQRRGEV